MWAAFFQLRAQFRPPSDAIPRPSIDRAYGDRLRSLIIDSSPCARINAVLRPGDFGESTSPRRFNSRPTTSYYKQYIPNDKATEFLKSNVPLFECPDATIEQTYYFRWWTYRKHIKQTPDGFVVTEFLPAVTWAGKYNTISCAAGHHLYEGRWLHDQQYLDDYSRFWFRKDGGNLHAYSNWIADAIWARYCVTGECEPSDQSSSSRP